MATTSAPDVEPKPKAGAGREILFSRHAIDNMALRGISVQEVKRAIAAFHKKNSRVDPKSGHIVVRDGDMRIVLQEDGRLFRVLTVMRASDFQVSFDGPHVVG